MKGKKEEVMAPPGAGKSNVSPEQPQDPRRLRAVEPAEAERAPRSPQRPSHNLPSELSSFVGREKELPEVRRLLENNRLLTLTGPGGCGKTRLALAAAGELVEMFEDGVWMVKLAPLTDPALVPQAVASTLGVREQPGRPLTETLSEHLRTRGLLVVLDNCEHLIESCAALADELLRSCPELRVLATSREALGIVGEISWPVPPLSLPDLRRMPDIESLHRYESARLFVERAAAVKPDFVLTEQNAAAVAQVCYRLDGIPLALELAAARVRVLSVEQIADRLDECFALLAAGARTAIPRHRTLHATMDWSYELLGPKEQILFRRLSIFVGGFSLEAAESVCAGGAIEGDEVLGLLSHLVDKSLVVAQEEGGEARYRLLETIHQYGREKLVDSGDEDEVGRRHVEHYVDFAEGAERELTGPDQARWLVRLEAEHDNLRAAFSWTLAESESVLSGVRLAAALWPFWLARGYLNEGRRWLESALARDGCMPSRVRAKALSGAGWLANFQGEYGAAKSLIEEGLALYRELGDKEGLALSIVMLGSVAVMGQRHDIPVEALIEEGALLRPEIEDRRTVAGLLDIEGGVALARGDLERAVELWEETLALYREVDDTLGIVACHTNLGLVRLAQGDYERSNALLRESVRLAWELDHKPFFQYSVIGLGGVAASRGWPVRAARLWGAAEGISETYGIHLLSAGRSLIDYDGRLAAVRSRLDETAWTAAWAEGRAMDLEEISKYARQEEASSEPDAASQTYSAGLSAREAEVLALVAAGLTNAEVAEKLYLSSRTVDWHLGSIYRKLEIHSRAEATRFAAEHGLL
jgi:predicted ATPase/DNA-binding CsgD family transcriptional regulator